MTNLLEVVTPLADGALVVLGAGLRGAVVIGAAGVATWLLRHRSAALRHQIWTAAILGQLTLLALVPVMPAIRLPVLPDVSWSIGRDAAPRQTELQQSATLPSNGAAQQNAAALTTPATVLQSETSSRASWSWPRITLMIWLAGALFVVLRFAIGTYNVARLARSSERVADGNWLSLAQRTANRLGIDRPLTLLSGDELNVPITWGVIYPVVLLPMEAEEWSEDRRRLVLVHEMAHVRRFDALTQFLAQIAVAIFWFSPLVWWAEQRMRVEREHACDDVVLRDGTQPALYADELLQMVRSLAARQAPAFAALAMARRSEFEGRMLAILDPARDRRFSNQRLLAFTSIALLAIAMPLAALTPVRGSLVKSSKNEITSGPDGDQQTISAAPTSGQNGISLKASQGKSSTAANPLPACNTADLKASSTSTHVQVDDDTPSQRDVRYLATNQGRCLEATLSGDIVIDDGGQVSHLAAGASAYVLERTVSGDRSLRLSGSGTGGVQSIYRVNNKSAELDAAGRVWFADRLSEVVREAALDVGLRVGRLRQAGKIDAVLAEIDRIRSSAAKREYYRALLQTRLTESETSRVIEQATRDLKSVPSDLKAVLEAANQGVGSASQQRASAANDALEQALAGMTSGSELRTVITVALPNADKDMLLMFARVAQTMSSDGEKGMLLRVAAPYYLTRRDQQMQNAYFRTVSTLASGLEQRDVLITALTFAQGSPSVTRAVIKSTDIMASSTEKAAVLLSAIAQKLITTDELRAEVLKASNTLAGERRQVLEALLQK